MLRRKPENLENSFSLDASEDIVFESETGRKNMGLRENEENTRVEQA